MTSGNAPSQGLCREEPQRRQARGAACRAAPVADLLAVLEMGSALKVSGVRCAHCVDLATTLKLDHRQDGAHRSQTRAPAPGVARCRRRAPGLFAAPKRAGAERRARWHEESMDKVHRQQPRETQLLKQQQSGVLAIRHGEFVGCCVGLPASTRTRSLQLPVVKLQSGSHLKFLLFLGDKACLTRSVALRLAARVAALTTAPDGKRWFQ